MKYDELVKALRCGLMDGDKCKSCKYLLKRDGRPVRCGFENLEMDAAAAIEALEAEAKRLQGRLCDWCAVCPKERRHPDDCELIGENPVMYGPSGAKMEVQDGSSRKKTRSDLRG